MKRLDLDDQLPPDIDALDRLHRAGWSIGDAAFHDGAGGGSPMTDTDLSDAQHRLVFTLRKHFRQDETISFPRPAPVPRPVHGA
jgi:hypothetical protein